MHDMRNDMDRILVTPEQLDEAVGRIAAEIDRDYDESGRRLLLLGILKGSVVFLGDLMKKIKRPVEIDFMKVKSYVGTQSTLTVNILLDLVRKDMNELDIIIVEDIVDSGNTLNYLTNYLRFKGAHSVRTATILNKPSRRIIPFTPDYIGVEVPDYFVVGYGLDYNEKYRALPYIGVLKPEIYEHNND